MYSMTGYGKGIAAEGGRELVCELKSVNHRFLDLGLRLPRQLNCIEDTLRRVLTTRLNRGHVDVYINYANHREDAKTVHVDGALLYAYVRAARDANLTLGLEDDLSLSQAIRLPDVCEIVEADDDREALCALAESAANAACDELISMRLSEGTRLKTDLVTRVNTLSALVERAEAKAPTVALGYKRKLEERIAFLTDGAELDRTRLATEVAIFADKAAIDEELCRLHSHVEQFLAFSESNAPAGRNLDFVVQEMNREFNTIGSKANDAELTNIVLAAKAEIEKLREQIQNVE